MDVWLRVEGNGFHGLGVAGDGYKSKRMASMDGRNRKYVRPGIEVDIVLKPDQRTGRLTRGVVKDLLTRSAHHPHGIKVRLTDGQVGRVKRIVSTPIPESDANGRDERR